MHAEYELTKFDIVLGGRTVGNVEKKTAGEGESYWIAVLELNDGTEYGSHAAGIGDSPDAAMQSIFPRTREKVTHMLRDLERLETLLSVPTLAELASI